MDGTATGTGIIAHTHITHAYLQFYLNICICIGNIDYISTQINRTFQPAQNSQCVDIPIVGDSVLENNETFFILLNTLDSDVILSQNLSTVVIIDNDGKLIRSDLELIPCVQSAAVVILDNELKQSY